MGTVLKKVVANDKYVIEKFGLTEERAEEGREKIVKKLLRSAGMHAES